MKDEELLNQIIEKLRLMRSLKPSPVFGRAYLKGYDQGLYYAIQAVVEMRTCHDQRHIDPHTSNSR